MHEQRISRSTLYASPLVSRTNLEFLTEQRRVRGITPAPLRAVVRLQSFSTMQTVHSAATGHESPREMQHQLIYAPVWKSQRGDAIRLEGRLVDVTWGKSKRERRTRREKQGYTSWGEAKGREGKRETEKGREREGKVASTSRYPTRPPV